MIVNGKEQTLVGGAKRHDSTYYLPISEMEKVYHLEINNINNQVITLDSLDREMVKADVVKNSSVNIIQSGFQKQ